MDRERVALAVLSGLDGSPVFVFDAEGRCVEEYGEFTGALRARVGSLHDFVGRSAQELLGDDTTRFLQVLKTVLDCDCEISRGATTTALKRRFLVEARLWKVRDRALVACQVREFRELSESPDERAGSNARLAAFVSQAAKFVCEIDEAGIITYVGPISAELGFPPEALVGTSIQEFVESLAKVDPEGAAIARRSIERFIASQVAVEPSRMTLPDREGRLRSLVSAGEWYLSASGEKRGILLFRDADDALDPTPTARARALSSLAGSLVDAVVEMTVNGEILSATPLPSTWDGAAEVLTGRSVYDFIHPADVDRGKYQLSKVITGLGLTPTIFRWRAKASGWRLIETRSIAYSQESGAARLIAVGRDVTDEFALNLDAVEPASAAPESSLHDTNLAVLASGVAHDFNNLLTISLGVTDLISEQLSPDSPARAYLSEVVTASRHAADLARQLLAVTGRPARAFAPIDVNAIIGGLQNLLRSAIPKSALLEFSPCDEPLWIHGDAAQVRQVILNLVTNAGEALGTHPGTISIRTKRETGTTAEGSAVIEVQDDGPGVEAELRERIFDATFSTKATGHGLGLTVVQSVIARHEGRISVVAVPGGGTVFRIEIPLQPEAVIAAEQQLRTTFSRPRETPRGVVLVVDDDAAVRRMSATMLRLANFTVLEAADAETARAAVASTAALACAVVDLIMPDADGLTLIDELRALRPNLKVVVCSGALDRLPAEQAGLMALEKPFLYAQLIETVWRCIEGGP